VQIAKDAGLALNPGAMKSRALFSAVRRHLGTSGDPDLRAALELRDGGIRTAPQPPPRSYMPATRGPLAAPKSHPRLERVPDAEFFGSREWKELRYEALLLHGAKCQCCGSSRADGKRIHVDHVKPRSMYPELQWDIRNLQVLCEDCNLGKGAWDQTDWRGLEL
jgi:hypothetical protein